jgi:hypothetical protein
MCSHFEMLLCVKDCFYEFHIVNNEYKDVFESGRYERSLDAKIP